ncbi:hypothetical protein DMENIID0001_094550 [Sergentomyia squamirostris]
MWTRFTVVFSFLLSLNGVIGIKSDFEVEYYWKQIKYEKLPLSEHEYIGKYPYYIPENNALMGISHYSPGGLILLTVPRTRPGIPSTLNAFCDVEYEYAKISPYLWGFPDYHVNTLKESYYGDSHHGDYSHGDYYSGDYSHGSKGRALDHDDPRNYSAGYLDYFFGRRLNNESDVQARKSNKQPYYEKYDYSIVSVFSPSIHKDCDRFYAVDTGTLEYGPHGSYRVQDPAILTYQLSPTCCTTKDFPLLRRIEIPNNMYKNPAGFIHITVDSQYKSKSTCDDVFIYLPNIYDNCLVVCDYKKGEFWALTDKTMSPVYAESHLVYSGFHYTFPSGISTVNTGVEDKDGNANTYYTPVANFGMYSVNSRILKDSKRASKYNQDDYKTLGYRGCDSQSFHQNIDSDTGVMFIQQMQYKQIRCWNTKNPINSDHIGVVYESEDLDFVSDISIDAADGYMRFISGPFLKNYVTDIPIDISKVNTKIYRGKITEIIKGTVCD